MRRSFNAAMIGVGLGLALVTGGMASAQDAVKAGVAPSAAGSALSDSLSTETAALAPGPFQDSRGTKTPGGPTTPSPLSQKDADIYAKVFALQAQGDWRAADKLIADLDDRLLMGHVRYQRLMHPTAYRATYKELKAWMAQYADHPDADKIYHLALRRRPSNWRYPIQPQNPVPDDFTLTDEGKRKSPAGKTTFRPRRSAEVRKVMRRIRYWVQRGSVTKSLEYLSEPRNRQIFDAVSYGESLGVIARGYFRYHKDADAIDVTREAIKRAGDKASNAAWWGGLAAFRAGDHKTAAKFFTILADSPMADVDDKAAGAFWASRSYLIGGEPDKVTQMLIKAAEEPRSFYGLLSIRALGLEPNFDWSLPVLGPEHADILRRIPAAKRAMALVQVGETTRAESELRRFAHVLPTQVAQVLVAMADRAGLADLAYRLGASLERNQGMRLDAAMYPVPGFAPDDGLTIDRAMLYAFIRRESRFRANAKSPAGARGLMQVMPATAGFVAGRPFNGNLRDDLLDPGLNLQIGQKYIKMLMDDPKAGENLFYTVAAYNGGPGNLQKWRAKVDYADDPLLFIESLPSRETRNYVENVLADMWIYRHRFGQTTPTLDSLLAGDWPVYAALDGDANAIRTAQSNSAQ
ncbi:lytic transglycosylase domain-containing protein [Hwanghaeella grinnelliae]|uniref:Lytic transglycosylase domain-containing protein n=1 Tax=Hwanghaeella grinnelliae TaxID=2500179 RepID=A0A3S2W3B0_9PROT|nr:lytic transglycosylase domain-containing protein [Hwanghaeella grinnelliae]RVU35021.1 lytic transglycosylase domain-containing protein [Hwanghaeella grinnelliae]